MTRCTTTRRDAVRRFWSLVAASPLLCAQSTPNRDSIYGPERIPPLEGVENALEMEEAARRRTAPDLFAHIAAGVGDERTLRRNREIFERITIQPRFLRDVTGLDLSTSVAGLELDAPILVGPTARHARLHPEGETETARGAAAADSAMIVSSRSDRSFGEIAAAGPASLWAQTVPGEANAPPAEARAFILTVDSPNGRVSDADIHYRFENAIERKADATPERADGWAALDGLVEAAGERPVFVKGLIHPGEALRAMERGAAGVVVSNHGGRSVDGLPSAVEMLPAMRRELGPDAALLVDGGFRRGSDIFKGLALGADAVLLGRPVLWALSAYGAEGVQRLLELLRSETALAMGLAGQTRVDAIEAGVARIRGR